MKVTLAKADPVTTKADLLAVPVFAGPELGPGAEEAVAGLGTPVAPLLEARGFTGKELEAIFAEAAGKGLEPWLDPLQRVPKPWPPDHPRAHLLKARSLVLNRQHERAGWLQTAELLDHLLADWKAMIPFNRWLERVP